jgi:integrase/recombinase XerD
MARIPPKKMADQIVRLLRKQNPDPSYVKKVFQYVREDLGLRGGKASTKRLPELMTEEELSRFYKAVWQASNRMHVVMLKLILFTGIRNKELVSLKLKDVDLDGMRIGIELERKKARQVLFPPFFHDELAEYVSIQRAKGAVYLFESNRKAKFTRRWIREIVKRYANKAGISKRIHPHLFRHQLLTFLTKKGIVDAKAQMISGHKYPGSMAIYKELNLSDIAQEYWDAMDDFPIH